ncbi:MAG TPA: FRG domain-containing protein [bacterium]|nr:FRG domain-containing protein [bacterium]
MDEQILIKNWNDFIEWANKVDRGPTGPTIFRGQPHDWPLCPSLTRILIKNKVNINDARVIENKLLEDFQTKRHLHENVCNKLNEKDLLAWWEIMQHYGAPTRLLDWTKSPYVALYFAVNDLSENDGVVYVLEVGHLNWIQSVRGQKDGADIRHVFEEIRKSIEGKDYKKSMVVIGSPTPTNRMQAQQSSLTLNTELLMPHDETADGIVFDGVHGGEGHTLLQKTIIPSQLKSVFMSELRNKGISADTMFPSIDGLGKASDELAKILSIKNKP